MSKRSRTKSYYDLFGIVFVGTFVLTFQLFPLTLLAVGHGAESEPGTASALGFVYFVGALAMAVPLLIKGGIIAPLVFGVLVVALDRILPGLLAFALAASASAYAACYLGHMINIDIAPPALSWDAGREALARPLAATASVIAAIVSSVIYVINAGETARG